MYTTKQNLKKTVFLNITCPNSITDVYVDFAADNQEFLCKDILLGILLIYL